MHSIVSLLYHNNRNGTFKKFTVEPGITFSADGKARAVTGDELLTVTISEELSNLPVSLPHRTD